MTIPSILAGASLPDAPSLGAQPQDPRLGPLLNDLAARLHPVLGDLPADAFAEIVRDIAATKLRWVDQGRTLP